MAQTSFANPLVQHRGDGCLTVLMPGNCALPPPTWKFEDIQAYVGPEDPFSRRNAALKKIRSSCEDEDGRVTRWEGVDVTQEGLALPDGHIVWRWQPMRKLMKEASLREVVGKGITKVWCKPIRDSYDFRRHWVRRNEQKKS